MPIDRWKGKLGFKIVQKRRVFGIDRPTGEIIESRLAISIDPEREIRVKNLCQKKGLQDRSIDRIGGKRIRVGVKVESFPFHGHHMIFQNPRSFFPIGHHPCVCVSFWPHGQEERRRRKKKQQSI